MDNNTINNTPVIKVEHVSKSFKLFFDRSYTLKERLIFWKRNRFEVREVLNDISFTINKGDSVGLIGRNGCGKSTMLKMLTKIYYPNKGNIDIKGRVSSLIELGAGFHPDMSGRENIYINASVYGLTKEDIDKRINKIIDFSELKTYIDNPIRTYSSGMYMRLAFAVAINVDADILLIDEILAVGDANFQNKCFAKLRELQKEGKTIVLVTHSMGSIKEFCNKCIWLEKGKVVADGDTDKVTKQYVEYMTKEAIEKGNADGSNMVARGNNFGTKEVEVTNVRLFSNKKEIDTIVTNDPLDIVIDYTNHKNINDFIVSVSIKENNKETIVYYTNTRVHKNNKNGNIILNFEHMPIQKGEYYIGISFRDLNRKPFDVYKVYKRLYINSLNDGPGKFLIDHKWERTIN